MKQIILMPLILFFLANSLLNCAYAQCKIFGDEHKPKGGIKSFTEECYTLGNGPGYLQLKTKFIYNDKGLLIGQTKYKSGSESDVVSTTIKYVYNKGKLVEEDASGQDVNINGVPGNTMYKVKYLYDIKGNLIEKKHISDFDNYSERYKYDSRNNLIESSNIGSDGIISSSKKMKYDSNRHKIEENYKDGDPNGNSGITNFQVDNKGNVLLEKAHFPNGNVRYSKTYQYNLRNNLTNEYCYTGEGKLYWQIGYRNQYDKLGNWISIVSYDSGTITTSGTILTKREIEYVVPIKNEEPAIPVQSEEPIVKSSQPALTISTPDGNAVYNVVLFDNFYDNKSSWPVQKNNNSNFYFINHSYEMEGFSPGVLEPVAYTKFNTGNDHCIEATLIHVSGDSNSGYGLTFSYEDSGNNYIFEISGAGNYRVCRFMNNEFFTLLPWTANDKILKGDGQRNKLQIFKKGDICEFYINATLVNSIDNMMPAGDYTGFIIENNQCINARRIIISCPKTD